MPRRSRDRANIVEGSALLPVNQGNLFDYTPDSSLCPVRLCIHLASSCGRQQDIYIVALKRLPLA
jgi:hypothetical protein